MRSSATAEDLPEASFAGQQETFLNVSGVEELLEACRKCYASLFTDRAISYREEKGFNHMKVALSVGVQKMVRSDKAGAGVMFTLDTETGFPHVIVINASWGLGENVVQGTVTPDEYIEWAKDGESEDLFIVQARPETVQSQMEAGSLKTYRLKEKGKRLLTGLSIGQAIATGKVCKIKGTSRLMAFCYGGRQG